MGSYVWHNYKPLGEKLEALIESVVSPAAALRPGLPRLPHVRGLKLTRRAVVGRVGLCRSRNMRTRRSSSWRLHILSTGLWICAGHRCAATSFCG